jgi:hypothetical protein
MTDTPVCDTFQMFILSDGGHTDIIEKKQNCSNKQQTKTTPKQTAQPRDLCSSKLLILPLI